MQFSSLTVDRGFREQCFNAYPGLRRNATFRRLFSAMMFPAIIDKDTGAPVLPYTLLAEIEGKSHQVANNNYVGRTLLKRYCTESGHSPLISGYDYRAGQARMVKDLRLDPYIKSALRNELATLPCDPVDFVSGRKPTRQSISNRRKEIIAMTTKRVSKYPETQSAVDYMNSVPPQSAAKAMDKYGEAAVLAAYNDPDEQRSLQNLRTLRFMREQSKQYFAASRSDRSRRLFPAHSGYGTLSKDIAAIVGSGWHEFDLRSSQLAICAYLWDVKEITNLLEAGQNIWEELCPYVNLDVEAGKPAVKDAVYALTFGAGDDRICGDLDNRFLMSDQLLNLGRHLLNHPMMAALRKARDQQLAAIKDAGGAEDCYGVWVPIPEDFNPRYRKSEPNPRSVLATLAQAVEFRILSPVFDLARKTEDFYITHWAHDGFCLGFNDQRRVESWIRRITEAVDAEAGSMGVRTVLEHTRNPLDV